MCRIYGGALIMAGMKEFAARVGNLAKQLGDEIESFRQTIVELSAERETVEQLPATDELAFSRIDDWIRLEVQRAKFGAPDIQFFQSGPESWRRPEGKIDVALLVYLAPLLAEAMKSEVKRLGAGQPSITEADRAIKLEALDMKILDAGLAEEGLIRSAETAGIQIPRRVDADPLAVLAADKELK
jgi:hypothetical protein